MEYSVDYFIQKFEAIPERNWCILIFKHGDKSCVNGHCGSRVGAMVTPESLALQKVFSILPITWGRYPINDANDSGYSNKAAYTNNGNTDQYKQPTPKQRILAALYDVKANQAVKEAEEILSSLKTINMINDTDLVRTR